MHGIPMEVFTGGYRKYVQCYSVLYTPILKEYQVTFFLIMFFTMYCKIAKHSQLPSKGGHRKYVQCTQYNHIKKVSSNFFPNHVLYSVLQNCKIAKNSKMSSPSARFKCKYKHFYSNNINQLRYKYSRLLTIFLIMFYTMYCKIAKNSQTLSHSARFKCQSKHMYSKTT